VLAGFGRVTSPECGELGPEAVVGAAGAFRAPTRAVGGTTQMFVVLPKREDENLLARLARLLNTGSQLEVGVRFCFAMIVCRHVAFMFSSRCWSRRQAADSAVHSAREPVVVSAVPCVSSCVWPNAEIFTRR
jgi:hypothetical protein